MSQFGWHNRPLDIREQAERLLHDLTFLLSDDLTGIYLHGSLAMGCFNPLRSDIDILVVTREKIKLETKHALARRLLDVSARPAPLEISFLSKIDLSPWRHPTPYDFHYSEDWREKFERELESGEWKNWNDGDARLDGDLAGHITVLRRRGLCLYGQPIGEVFPPVPERDFVDSILADVLSAKFGLAGAREKYPVYVVLNACRTLTFLRTKRVVSKAEGGVWALENLPEEFRPTIAGALDEYLHGRNEESRLRHENLSGFANYMKNEIERAKRAFCV